MQQLKAGRKLYLVMAFALFTGGVAHAEPVADFPVAASDYKALKVVGRGILNKETQDTLQLACVGKRIQKDSLERECNVLNFLLTEVSGTQRLVGKPFFLSEESDTTVRKQMKQMMLERGIQASPSSSDVMAYTRGLFRREDGGNRWFAIVFSGLAFVAGMPAWGLAAGPGVLLLVDLLSLPMALIDNARYGDKALSVKSADALRDRAMDQWQVRPKKIRAKRFNRVLSVLNEEGVDLATLGSLEEQVKESEEDQRIEEEEAKSQIKAALPVYSGDTNSECFVDSIEISYRGKFAKAEAFALQQLGREHLSEYSSSVSLSDAMLEKLGFMKFLRRRGFVFDEAAIFLENGTRGSKIKAEIKDRTSRGELSKFIIESTLLRGGEELGRSIVKQTPVRYFGRDGFRKAAEMTEESLKFYGPNCDDLSSRKTHRQSASFF